MQDQQEPLLYIEPSASILGEGNAQESDSNISKGEKQPNACRDWPFALLFYCHLIAMIALGCSLGAPALARKTDEDDNQENYSNDYEGKFI